MKARVTRKRVILHKSFFHELCFGKCLKLMALFNFPKIRTSIDVVSFDKRKVTFGFKYIFPYIAVLNTQSLTSF